MRKLVLFGYFWGLLVLGADLGTRLTSDSHSGSQGYCGSSEAKDYVVEIEEMSNESPLMIFYPSGENSGGEIDIYHNDFIQRIAIKSNGKVINEIINY